MSAARVPVYVIKPEDYDGPPWPPPFEAAELADTSAWRREGRALRNRLRARDRKRARLGNGPTVVRVRIDGVPQW